MKAFVFPGQGAQFSGMGNELYASSSQAQELFEQANEILGFRISDLMFSGNDEELKQTKVTQPAVFLHSVILAKVKASDQTPSLTAGHSLGEFSALVANGSLSFEDGLKLVALRASAMQRACEMTPSTMAAVLGLDDAKVEEVCKQVQSGIVVPANYNCPGQLVISGDIESINTACVLLKEAGAKRALVLSVGGAFHSPLMEPAKEELAYAIKNTPFSKPFCPVVQNVNAQPASDPTIIQSNLISQLTAPVRWTQSVQRMVTEGTQSFLEIGPGSVLQGLIKKIAPEVETAGLS